MKGRNNADVDVLRDYAGFVILLAIAFNIPIHIQSSNLSTLLHLILIYRQFIRKLNPMRQNIHKALQIPISPPKISPYVS
jgi:hypothetical protein